MSSGHARIHPKRQALDFVRFAEAILQMAEEVGDDSLIDEGRSIRRRIHGNAEDVA